MTMLNGMNIIISDHLERPLSHRRTYVDSFERPVWAYEATPAGLKALEEE